MAVGKQQTRSTSRDNLFTTAAAAVAPGGDFSGSATSQARDTQKKAEGNFIFVRVYFLFGLAEKSGKNATT